MNAKYCAALTAIVLALGLSLSLPMRQAQASQVVLTKIFNDVLVQRFPKSLNLSSDSASPPPPVNGAPRDRKPAGTHSHNHLRFS